MMLLRFIELLSPAAAVKKVVIQPKGGICMVLLGWGGSKTRHLNKIVKFYSSRPSVGSIVTFSMPLWAPQFVRNVLVKNLRRIVEKDARIMCHAFSNNGTWVFGELGKELAKDGAQIERVVIDSAPYFKYSAMSLKEAVENYQPVVLSTLLNKNIYHHPLFTPPLKVILYTMGLGVKVIYSVPVLGPAIVPDLISLSAHLRDKINIPTLVIYGRKDKLIPPSEVEGFASALESRGVPVEKHIFEHAKHVSGFYDEGSREEYKNTVSTFFKV